MIFQSYLKIILKIVFFLAYLVSFIILYILCIKNNCPEERSTVSTRLPKESKGTKLFRTFSLVLLAWIWKYFPWMNWMRKCPSKKLCGMPWDYSPGRWKVGLLLWLHSNESACQCRRHRFNSCVRKIPWRRKGQPTPVFLPGKIPWTEDPGRLQSMESQKSHAWLSD